MRCFVGGDRNTCAVGDDIVKCLLCDDCVRDVGFIWSLECLEVLAIDDDVKPRLQQPEFHYADFHRNFSAGKFRWKLRTQTIKQERRGKVSGFQPISTYVDMLK